jgi:hypothetical protein
MSKENCNLPSPDCGWRQWHVPLHCDQFTLREVLASTEHIAADQDDIPLIVQIIENPKFDIPGITIFNGAVDLQAHDCIHAVLGRGLLPHDEAFTIGFTMGSTNRVTTAEQRLYSLAAKYLYPGPYKFTDEDIQIFQDGVHLGYVSDCQPLDKIDYTPYLDSALAEVRHAIGIEIDLLQAYYRIEQRRYPHSVESQRLLVT